LSDTGSIRFALIVLMEDARYHGAVARMAVEDQGQVRQIGRYTILERLDAGGSAEVFIAQRAGDSKLCVLKRLQTRLEGHPTAPRRLYREAHLASFLRHPHIAEIIGASVEDGRFVMAFEFVAGQTIEALMQMTAARGRRVPLDLCIGIAFAMLDALDYAHDLTDPDGRPLEIVHRDLSPRNVLIGYDGVVKVIDFGIARGNVDEFRTEPGVVVGTLRYLSPEQALTLEVDRRSDLYTIAVLLFELMTGRPLVPDESPIEVLRYVVNEPAPYLSEVEASIPRALDPIFARALAKDRELRFPNARALKDAIARIPNLPRPAGAVRLGQLVRELFPEGAAWAQRIAQIAVESSRARMLRPEDTMDDTSSLTANEIMTAPTISYQDRTQTEAIDDPDATEVHGGDLSPVPIPPLNPAHPLNRSRGTVEVTNPPVLMIAQRPPSDSVRIPSRSAIQVQLLTKEIEVLRRRTRSLSMMLVFAVACAIGIIVRHLGADRPSAAASPRTAPAPAPDPTPPAAADLSSMLERNGGSSSVTAPVAALERTEKAEASTRASGEEEKDADAASELLTAPKPEAGRAERQRSHPKPVHRARNLTRMLKDVREHPNDKKRFDDLARAVSEESARLPESARRRVQNYLESAHASKSPDQLEKAIGQLGRPQ
jgi:serine/threonine protein kinase